MFIITRTCGGRKATTGATMLNWEQERIMLQTGQVPAVDPMVGCVTSKEEQHRCLKVWDMSTVIKVLVREGHDQDEAEAMVEEYRKYMGLIIAFPDEAHAMSTAVDPAWHAHIINTADYFTFCSAIHGTFIHHQISIDGDPLPVTGTVKRLIELYGEVDPKWWGKSICCSGGYCSNPSSAH